ncbi:MAG: YncE family protein [Gemmatimonadetes bacterium]|nr:YncE family protein [Gemmatimonadota bacterium]
MGVLMPVVSSSRALPRLLAFALLGVHAGGCTESQQGVRGAKLYVTVGFEDRVHVLDARDGTVTDILSLNPRPGEVDEPHGVAVHPSTGHWYATLSHGTPTLWKFEGATDRLTGRLRLPLQGASRIGLSPDGSLALVPDYYRGSAGEPTSVALVDLRDLTVLGTHRLCVAPHDAAFAPDGRGAALACSLSDEIVLFPPDEPGAARSVRLDRGSRPMNLAWSQDGSRLFATLMGAGAVVVIDPLTAQVAARIPTGGSPAQIAAQPKGPLLAVANRAGGSFSLIDAGALTELGRFPVPGSHPHGVAWHPDGQSLFITYEGDTDELGGLVAFDLEGKPLWEAELGSYVLGVAAVATPLPRDPPDRP